ncbi:MAG: DUF29 domain-containing protein [Hyphomonadaceae bacterium]|nr:DUF29 domain-containing protein [Hyphomonadaceae bacterium]
MAIDDLYERDFYLWTQAQAEALRAHARSPAARGSNAVDWEHVAGEIEDLGNSDYFAVRSFTTRIIEHLFKLAWSSAANPRTGWQAEVIRFRAELDGRLSKALRNRLEGDVERLHVLAARAVEREFAGYEPSTPCDLALRWSLPQILGEEDDPIA